MASNFSFQPFGLSQLVTITTGTATVSLTLVSPGGVTASLSAGGYLPSTIRIVNLTAATPVVQFGNSTVTIGAATGMYLGSLAIEKFSIKGYTHMATSGVAATIAITLGEGR